MFLFHSAKTEGPNGKLSKAFGRLVYWFGCPKTCFKFSEGRNSVQKCFHLFKYVKDHKNVRAFFLISLRTCSKSLNDVNSLHYFALWFLLYYLLYFFQLRVRRRSHWFIAMRILFMNIWILWKFPMRKKNNLENNLERNLTIDWARECIFRASEGTNF